MARPNKSISQSIHDAPMGLIAFRTFLWLISVVAVFPLLVLLVLRPSLVFTSESSGPSESVKLETLENPEGVVCSFPNLES
jgi:hypothetical protein